MSSTWRVCVSARPCAWICGGMLNMGSNLGEFALKGGWQAMSYLVLALYRL